jgi:hypothetical protein
MKDKDVIARKMLADLRRLGLWLLFMVTVVCALGLTVLIGVGVFMVWQRFTPDGDRPITINMLFDLGWCVFLSVVALVPLHWGWLIPAAVWRRLDQNQGT